MPSLRHIPALLAPRFNIQVKLSGGRIVQGTIKAVVETTEGVRLRVSFGDETALIYPWQIVIEARWLRSGAMPYFGATDPWSAGFVQLLCNPNFNGLTYTCSKIKSAGRPTLRLTAEVVKNLSAASGVAYIRLGAILLSLDAPNPAPKVCYWQRTSGSRPALY